MTHVTDRDAHVIALYPDRSGANIETWIGFKCLLAMIEQGLFAWFRANDLGAQWLYHEHGLALEIAELSAMLNVLVQVDDRVEVAVRAVADRRFEIELRVRHGERDLVAARGRARMVARSRREPAPPAPARLAGLVDTSYPSAPSVHGDGYGSSWRATYYDCAYSTHVRFGRFTAVVEQAIDEFLAARGLAIGPILRERGWIPVVSRVRVTQYLEVAMDEVIQSRVCVEDVLKDRAWDSRIECSVVRSETHTPCATAQILHGYAYARGELAGTLVAIDRETLAAIAGASR